MSNDITINSGSGGASVAADEAGGAHYQRIKITDGVEDSTVALGVVADDAAVVAADTGILAMAVATPTDGSVDANDTGYVAMSTDRRLHVDAEIAAGAASFVKLEDVANAGADAGVPAMAVRKSTPADLSGSDGDYEFLQMDNGKLWTSAAITAASGSIVAGAVAAGASSFVKLEDVANAGADAGVPAMAVRKATPIDLSGTDGDYEFLQMDNGRLWASAVITAGPGSATSAATAFDSYSHVAINLTTGADQVLVSSASGKQIWVYGYAFTAGDAAGQTVSLQDEDNLAITGIMEFDRYYGITVPPSGNFEMPLFKLATDKDLEIDITGGDVDGWLTYAIVSV